MLSLMMRALMLAFRYLPRHFDFDAEFFACQITPPARAHDARRHVLHDTLKPRRRRARYDACRICFTPPVDLARLRRATIFAENA